MQKKEFTTEIGGETLTVTFSNLVDQAGSAVFLTYGETVVLATATMSSSPREGMNFFPLTVDFEERFYAAGQILGSRFMRREGRPSDEAILSGRMVDRTIRPLFDDHIRNEIQVVITVIALGDEDPDIIAINAASLALATSDIPWNGPVSAVRVTQTKAGEKQINPTYKQRETGTILDAIICGRGGDINMIDADAREVADSDMEAVLTQASEEIEKLQTFQASIITEMNKEKVVIPKEELSDEETALFTKEIMPRLDAAVFAGAGKKSIGALEKDWVTLYKETFPDGNKSLAAKYYDEAVNDIIHSEAVANDRRADGRKMEEIRDLYAQAGGVSPLLHGTGIFYRGGTHALSVLTLGGPKDVQLIDGMEVKAEKRYIHHYNFPPYSVGETGRMGGLNRRMIGHGALAEKALIPVLPSKEDFPYVVRIVSEAIASNGSTSMASVCGSTLALMDAGVPISKPVGGMAMGLMYQDKDNYKILTDIQGPEDHHGDMDFKVAGTRDGITAVQMDVKVDGIPVSVLAEAFVHAKNARIKVIDRIEEEISAPRADTSAKAPHIITIKINPDDIGKVIGGGGKTINGIIDETGAQVDIEDDGTVFVMGKDGAAEKARDMVEQITHEYKAGERFVGEVVKILEFGAFVKLSPYADGLVHISELAPVRIEKVTDILKEGDKVPVVVKEVDDRGRIGLSIKQADPDIFKERLTKLQNNEKKT